MRGLLLSFEIKNLARIAVRNSELSIFPFV